MRRSIGFPADVPPGSVMAPILASLAMNRGSAHGSRGHGSTSVRIESAQATSS